MGNQFRSERKIQSTTLLEFYTLIHHPKHQTVAIYESKHSMKFIMKLQRSIVRSRLFHAFQQITDQDAPYLMILYGFKIQRNVNCSICTNNENKEDKTVQFWQYLNYSLSQHIRYRIKRKSPFTQHQIWHILQVILESLNVLTHYGLFWQVNANHLLITPEGKLKCQWSICELNINEIEQKRIDKKRILQQNGEQIRLPINEYIYKGNNSISSQSIEFKSPEEIKLLQQGGERAPKLNTQKSNIYKIGLLILYILSMEHPNHHNINDLLIKIKSSLLQQNFLRSILNILNWCLKVNPKERCSISQLQKYCRPYFSDEYEILINEQKKQDLQEYNMQAQFKLQKKIHNNKVKDFQNQRKASIIQDINKYSYMRDKSKRQNFAIWMNNNSIINQEHLNSIDKRIIQLRQYRKHMLKAHQNPQ